MGDYSDSKQIERIMSCPAGINKLKNIVNTLKGSTITDLHFSNCISSIGVHIELNRNHTILVHLPELSLDALVADPEIRAQELALYYQEYPDRRPKSDAPSDTPDNTSRTRTINPVDWNLCRSFGFCEAWEGWENPCSDLSWAEDGKPAPTLEEKGSPVYFEDEDAVVCCDANSIFISAHNPEGAIYTKWERTATREEAIEKLKALPEDYFDRRQELGFTPE